MSYNHFPTFAHISIHALREESDLYSSAKCVKKKIISIHALREESDCNFYSKW